MRTPDDIKKKATLFSETEIRTLSSSAEDVKSLIQMSKISEDALRKLDNVISTLQGVRENFMWRIIRAAQQNHMLD
jgi:hypothetical protein